MIQLAEKLAFLDVETTGLNPFYGDRICEIAIIACRGLDIEQEFSSLINPQRPVSAGAYAVNGISNTMVRDAPRFADVSIDVLKLIKDRIIICHNANFDLGFLGQELAQIDIELPQISVIDTLNLARRYFNFSSNSLSNIAYCLGIDLEDAHRALGDARTTREVFTNFIPELADKGIKKLNEITINWKSANKLTYPDKSPPVLSALIEEIINDKKPVKIIYVSEGGNRTERIIEPLEVTSFSDYVYLVGFCRLRNEERTFRLDRIVEIGKIAD